jgi:hexokinase
MGKVVVCATVIGATAACAVATVLIHRYVKKSKRWGKAKAILKEFEEKCATPSLKLKQVADAMTVEMHAGLASEGGSKLKMLISFVDNLPTGYSFFFFLFDPIQITLIFSFF